MNNSICDRKLEQLREEVSILYGNASHANLDLMKSDGSLDNLIELLDIDGYLKVELIDFLNLLYTEEFDNFPALRKMFLHESDFVGTFRRYDYEIASYINNKDAYRHFPKYVMSCIEKFIINADKDIMSRLNEFIDMSVKYDTDKRELCEIMPRFANNCSDMSKYDSKIKNHNFNLIDKDEFAVWSELTAYNAETSRFGQKTIWVSKEHGDGYGYDILCYDPLNNKEKMVEVKSGHYDNFSLTLNEYKTMIKTEKYPTSDYYIYRYFRDGITGAITLKILRYDKENHVLRNTTNFDEVYYTSPNMYFDNKGKRVIEFCIEKEEDYMKSLGVR